MGKRGPKKGPGLIKVTVRKPSTDEQWQALRWFEGEPGEPGERLDKIVQAYKKEQTDNVS